MANCFMQENSPFKPLSVITKILYELPAAAFANSYSFHDAMEDALKKQGWFVIREFQIKKRSNGRIGFIDLVVTRPIRIALELDFKSPRKNSILKLEQFFGFRFVILRKSRRVIPVSSEADVRKRY